MKVLLFEDDLIWSSRLSKTLKSLGHEPEVMLVSPLETDAKVAIINLASKKIDPETTVPALRNLGVFVIGHAGHKEQENLQLGSDCGCDLVASNSSVTYKIEQLLDQAIRPV
jgi:selenocysteine lyase/cysteine desulfurase